MFKVFVRNWWKLNPAWPGGREPDAGARKTTLCHVTSEAEARQVCQEYNATHKEGKLARRAEYTRV